MRNAFHKFKHRSTADWWHCGAIEEFHRRGNDGSGCGRRSNVDFNFLSRCKWWYNWKKIRRSAIVSSYAPNVCGVTWFRLCQTTSWVTIPIYYPPQLYRRNRRARLFLASRRVFVDMESDKKNLRWWIQSNALPLSFFLCCFRRNFKWNVIKLRCCCFGHWSRSFKSITESREPRVKRDLQRSPALCNIEITFYRNEIIKLIQIEARKLSRLETRWTWNRSKHAASNEAAGEVVLTKSIATYKFISNVLWMEKFSKMMNFRDDKLKDFSGMIPERECSRT